MQDYGSLLAEALVNLLVWAPSHCVVLVGFIIALFHLTKHRKPAALALLGLFFLVLSALFSVVYTFVPLLIEQSNTDFGAAGYTVVYRTLNVFHSLINAVGLAFLLWAVFIGRDAKPEYSDA